MDDQTPAAPSTPTHRPLIPAVDGVSAPNLPGESPPPVATVGRRGPSPASAIGVASARAAPDRRSPRRSVPMRPVEGSMVSTEHYGPSVADDIESPARVGGDIATAAV